MSTSSLSLTQAKNLAIDFIKKYKDLLRDGNNCDVVDDDDIKRYEAMSPSNFFNEVTVQANFGSNFNLFDLSYRSNGNKAMIWMGEHRTVSDLARKISQKSKKEDLLHFWQMDGTWYNFTTTRLDALAEIFDRIAVTKAKTQTAKKPVKKADIVTKISDATEVQNEIAFVNFDAKKFEHALQQGGTNFDPMVSAARDNGAPNQIDHAINAFKLAKKELDVLISELVKAKDAGAKHVVDSDWCERKDFKF